MSRTAMRFTAGWCMLTIWVSACSPGGGSATLPPQDLGDLPPDRLVLELARRGDLENLRAVVEAQPQLVYVQDVNDETPLHAAASQGRDAVVEFLLQRGADPHAINANGETPRQTAERRGHRSTARLLGQGQ